MYSEGATDQNYLRGVQEVDANGIATFTSIFPVCYSGRWPHVHFEVYPNVDAATSGGSSSRPRRSRSRRTCATRSTPRADTSRACRTPRGSLTSDMVFSDGVSTETPSMTGNTTSGYVSSLAVGVSSAV